MYNVELDEDSRHLYTPCSSLTSRFSDAQLVMTCNDACGGLFYARCCVHREGSRLCHHSRIVYTDGACLNNGKSNAVAGIGIAFGTHHGDKEGEYTHQFSIPVDDRLDPGGKRTSQRVELLAALEGLKKICDHDAECLADDSERSEQGDEDLSRPAVIITTDSEYVVKGMTEWLPNWKRNGLRKSNGQRPSNLDLFRKLDAEVEERERIHDCQVMFWHIDRTHNTVADQLAKCGARAAARGVNEELGEVIYAISAWELSD